MGRPPGGWAVAVRVPIRITISLDLDAYRREYGEPDATADEAKEYVRELAAQGVEQALRPFDYAAIADDGVGAHR